jgi:hypothetical protein
LWEFPAIGVHDPDTWVGNDMRHVCGEEGVWKTGYMGTNLYALHSLLYKNRLKVSEDKTRGERFSEGKPATHVANSEFMSSALTYAKGVQIHGNGHYVNIVLEVIYLDSLGMSTNKNKGGQVDVGTNPNRVKFVGLWVESYTHFQGNDKHSSFTWDGKMECNPTDPVMLRAYDKYFVAAKPPVQELEKEDEDHSTRAGPAPDLTKLPPPVFINEQLIGGALDYSDVKMEDVDIEELSQCTSEAQAIHVLRYRRIERAIPIANDNIAWHKTIDLVNRLRANRQLLPTRGELNPLQHVGCWKYFNDFVADMKKTNQTGFMKRFWEKPNTPVIQNTFATYSRCSERPLTIRHYACPSPTRR